MSGSGATSSSGTGSGSGSGAGPSSGPLYSEIQFHQYDPNEGEQRRKRKPPDPGRPYQCDICPKSFDRPSTLAQHILSHSGERPHVCPFCQMRFTVASNLYRHIRGCPSKPPDVDVENDYYIPSRNRSNRSSTNRQQTAGDAPDGGGTLISLDGPSSSSVVEGEAPLELAPTARGRGPGRPRGSRRRQQGRGIQTTTTNPTSTTDAVPQILTDGPTPRTRRAARRSGAVVEKSEASSSASPELTRQGDVQLSLEVPSQSRDARRPASLSSSIVTTSAHTQDVSAASELASVREESEEREDEDEDEDDLEDDLESEDDIFEPENDEQEEHELDETGV